MEEGCWKKDDGFDAMTMAWKRRKMQRDSSKAEARGATGEEEEDTDEDSEAEGDPSPDLRNIPSLQVKTKAPSS